MSIKLITIESNNTNIAPNEYRLIRKDGKIINVQTNISIKYKTGKAVEVIGTCFDITKLKVAEEGLRQQSQIRQLLMELASSFINIPLEEFPNAINNALANMGEFLEVDRAYHRI